MRFALTNWVAAQAVGDAAPSRLRVYSASVGLAFVLYALRHKSQLNCVSATRKLYSTLIRSVVGAPGQQVLVLFLDPSGLGLTSLTFLIQ